MLAKTDTRTMRREATRERILKAAWRLARKNGLAGLSLRDLADAVGMRAPSLYKHFPSKNAIYDAMFAQGMREARDMMDVETIPDDLESMLKVAAQRFISFCTSDPVRYQLLFLRTIPGFEPSPESFAISAEALEEMRRRFSSFGLDDGRWMDLWTALSSGLVAQQLANDPGGDRWARLAGESVEMFVRHFKAKKRKGARR